MCESFNYGYLGVILFAAGLFGFFILYCAFKRYKSGTGMGVFSHRTLRRRKARNSVISFTVASGKAITGPATVNNQPIQPPAFHHRPANYPPPTYNSLLQGFPKLGQRVTDAAALPVNEKEGGIDRMNISNVDQTKSNVAIIVLDERKRRVAWRR